MDKLLEKFKKLTQEEKDAILIYQSCLFYFINEITSIFNYEILSAEEIYKCIKSKEEFINKFESFKEIINNPKNLIFKMGVLKNVSTTNIEEFIKSLLNIINILDSIKNKIILEDSITLYRGVCVNNLDTILLGKGKYISTSVDSNVAFNYASSDGHSILFKINVCSPLSIIISPYRIGLVYDKEEYLDDDNKVYPTILKMLVNDTNQKEILLYRDEIEYEIVSKKEIDHIFIIEVNVWSKNLISKK